MRLKRIITGISMIFRMLLRRRIVIIALLVIPVVFLSVVELTASTKIIFFKLASIDEEVLIKVSQKHISLIFFSVTSAGFLVSFLALTLIQGNSNVNRRLVLCGYHPNDLLVSILLSLLILILVMAIYIGLLIHLFVPIEHFLMYILGLALIGFVYGCYGLAVGSVIRGKLEGVFMIVLLANIDAGWLQNPMYYADASNNIIIRYLPAYFPSQSALIAVFTDYSGTSARIYSLLYGSGFLILSLYIFYKKMRIRK